MKRPSSSNFVDTLSLHHVDHQLRALVVGSDEPPPMYDFAAQSAVPVVLGVDYAGQQIHPADSRIRVT
jgi:hypothetical protein